MLLTAAWHILPWWSWIAVVVGIAVILFVPGAAAVFSRVVATVVKLIPWRSPWTYVAFGAIAAVIGFRFWLDMHDQALLAGAKVHELAAVDARDAYWKGREARSNVAHAAVVAALQHSIDATNADAKAHAAQAAADLARERAESARRGKELEDQRSRNVTAQANAMCTLTRGVVLQFDAGARRANGSDPFGEGNPATGAGSELVDRAAGVPLATYARAVEYTQDALRTCRAQVVGWQKHYTTVLKPWIASTVEQLNSCIPKGSP